MRRWNAAASFVEAAFSRPGELVTSERYRRALVQLVKPIDRSTVPQRLKADNYQGHGVGPGKWGHCCEGLPGASTARIANKESCGD